MASLTTRRRGAPRLVCSALCVLVATMSLGARADRVAAVPPRVTGTDTTTLRDGFLASLAGGLAAAGHDTPSASELERALAAHPALAACTTEVCLAQLGELLSLRALLRSSVEVIGSSNYSFRLELYDLAAGHVIALLDDACTICTVREANEALSRAAASLGRKLGAAPLALAATAPAPAQRPAAHPPMRSLSTPRSRLFLGLGAGALVLGLGAVAGAVLIAIDGRATGDPSGQPGEPLTRPVEHTRVAGIVLTAAGGLVLAGAGVLFWRAHANRRAVP